MFCMCSKKDYVSLVKIRKSYISHHKLSILKKWFFCRDWFKSK